MSCDVHWWFKQYLCSCIYETSKIVILWGGAHLHSSLRFSHACTAETLFILCTVVSWRMWSGSLSWGRGERASISCRDAASVWLAAYIYDIRGGESREGRKHCDARRDPSISLRWVFSSELSPAGVNPLNVGAWHLLIYFQSSTPPLVYSHELPAPASVR